MLPYHDVIMHTQLPAMATTRVCHLIILAATLSRLRSARLFFCLAGWLDVAFFSRSYNVLHTTTAYTCIPMYLGRHAHHRPGHICSTFIS